MTTPSPQQSVSGPAARPAPRPAKGAVVKAALGSLARSPAFVVAGAILLLAAIGINGATQALSLNFRKQAVPLRQPLATLPKKLGPWVQVSKDQALSEDIQHVLGTEKYIFRDYVNSAEVPASRLAEFEGRSATECAALLYGQGEQRDKAGNVTQPRVRGILEEYPRAVVRLSLTYYTGMVDTVAHIPDRCFVADGYRPTVYEQPRWKIVGMNIDADGFHIGPDGKRLADPAAPAKGSDAGLPVRFINFEDQDNRGSSVSRNVTYFFSVNGRYNANPLDVRTTLQNLFEKHGYYAKVELMTLLRDTEASASVKRDFLGHALPEIEKCLPDWSARGTQAPPAGQPASAAPER
jgi:hypothetical protein